MLLPVASATQVTGTELRAATVAQAQAIATVTWSTENRIAKTNVTGSHKFPDVKSGDWFNNAVTWANQNSVVGGYGDGTFQPNKNVSLQEVAVILWNYAGNPTPTGDASSVGAHDDWATNALSWAVANGIFKNMPYDTVTGTATRAQTAQMLMNYLSK